MQSRPGNVKSPKYRTICLFVHRPREYGPRDCHESPAERFLAPHSVPRRPVVNGPSRRPAPTSTVPVSAAFSGWCMDRAAVRPGRLGGKGRQGTPGPLGRGLTRIFHRWRACATDARGQPRGVVNPRPAIPPLETFGKSGSSPVSGNDGTIQHVHRGTFPDVP